jgi:hypothetical protein
MTVMDCRLDSDFLTRVDLNALNQGKVAAPGAGTPGAGAHKKQ